MSLNKFSLSKTFLLFLFFSIEILAGKRSSSKREIDTAVVPKDQPNRYSTLRRKHKPLLVLDIENALIFSRGSKIRDNEVFEFKANGIPYFAAERPFLCEFFEFVKGKFSITICTLKTKEYANEVAKYFEKKYEVKFKKIISKEDIENFNSRYYMSGFIGTTYSEPRIRIELFEMKDRRIVIVSCNDNYFDENDEITSHLYQIKPWNDEIKLSELVHNNDSESENSNSGHVIKSDNELNKLINALSSWLKNTQDIKFYTPTQQFSSGSE